MPGFNTVMDVFKLLDKSNCRKCNEATCLAFAASVFKGSRQLNDCPHVPSGVAGAHGVQEKKNNRIQEEFEQEVQRLKDGIRGMDLHEAALRIQGDFDGEKLTLKILGKPFRIDRNGTLYSDIHINPYVVVPFLNYVLNCQGRSLSGSWMPMRELPGGKDWERFFDHQCVTPMKKIADSYPDLFEDLVDIFNGKPALRHYQSDIAIVLSPLPLVPMLICYWKPEDAMASDLKLFFDASAGDNLGVQGIYSLGTGIVRMFSRLALTHGIG